LVGLVATNSILIGEFAREQRAKGLSIVDATAEAAKLRFRPILMKAATFMLGTLPLIIVSRRFLKTVPKTVPGTVCRMCKSFWAM